MSPFIHLIDRGRGSPIDQSHKSLVPIYAKKIHFLNGLYLSCVMISLNLVKVLIFSQLQLPFCYWENWFFYRKILSYLSSFSDIIVSCLRTMFSFYCCSKNREMEKYQEAFLMVLGITLLTSSNPLIRPNRKMWLWFPIRLI